MHESRAPFYITRKVSFSASHRYENPQWSVQKNQEVFGKCYNPFGHGHNYELEVTIQGSLDSETGMVLNLRDVDAILNEHVILRFDHRFINKEVKGFETVNPTVENLCLKMWELLEPKFRKAGCRLYRVRLYESSDMYGEYYGESVVQ